MENGSITSKDIIGWIVGVIISLVPLLIFYLQYQIDKEQSNKKIEKLKKMLYKEIIARKNLEINELKKEVQKLKEENKELKKRVRKKLIPYNSNFYLLLMKALN